jgi:Icc-related predicted phosphoesterase
MVLADIHQMPSKWKLLVKEAIAQKPDVLAIAGDLLPKDRGIPEQMNFHDSLFKYAKQIRNAGIEIVLTLGNDDNINFVPYMRDGEEKDLWHYLQDSFCEVQGYRFVGMPYVPDHPFGYKQWVRGETRDNLRIDTLQLGEPLMLNADNEFHPISDYANWLSVQDTLDEKLEWLARQVKDMSKSIWLIHAPPSLCGLDVCVGLREVGSETVLKFITRHQPLLTIHGHIHESPVYSGRWFAKNCNTTSIQAGQCDNRLWYANVRIDDMGVTMSHSVLDKGEPQ